MAAEDAAAYDRMVGGQWRTWDDEIARLERQEAMDERAEPARPRRRVLATARKPGQHRRGAEAPARDRQLIKERVLDRTCAARACPARGVRRAAGRSRTARAAILAPGRVPERTLIDALQDENIFRPAGATSSQTESGERKIPVVASQGHGQLDRRGSGVSLKATTAFGQVSIGAYKLGDHDQGQSEELLRDSSVRPAEPTSPEGICPPHRRGRGRGVPHRRWHGQAHRASSTATGGAQTRRDRRGAGRHHLGRGHRPVLRPARALPQERRCSSRTTRR